MPPLGRLLSAQAVPLALVALVNVAMVLALEPGARGRAAATIASGSLLASLCFLDLHLGVVARYRAGDRNAPARGLLIAATISGALLTLAAIAALAGDRLTSSALGPGGLPIALAGSAFCVIALVSARVLQALVGASAYFLVVSVQAAVYTAAVLGFIVSGRLDSTSAAIAWLGGAAAAAVVGAAVLRPLLTSRRKGASSRPGALRLSKPGVLRLSLTGHLASCAYQVLYRSDLLLLAGLSTAADVGNYAVAVAVAEVVWQVAEAVALSTYAHGARSLDSSALADGLATHLRRYRLLAVPLALLAFAGLAATVRWVIPEYRPAVWLLLLLLPGVVAGGELRIRLASLNTDPEAGQRIRYLAGGAVLSCLIYVPAIAAFGAAGAAAATTVVYAGNAAIARRLARTRRPASVGVLMAPT